MNNNLNFTPTFKKLLKSTSDSKVWDSAIDLFDNGKYKESFYETLNYIDKDLIKNYGNAEKTEFKFPQGSAIVIVKLVDDKVEISAPFVKIPATKFLPIFRKCTELNFNVMTLPQIVIHNDYLVFEYSMPIDLCEPFKFYDVLRDIALNADKYDDEFVEKFGAERIMEPMVANYDDAMLEEVLSNCKSIATESLAHIEYFESKRRNGNACDALYVALKRLDYYCEPSGMFYNKLDAALGDLFNNNNDWMARLKTGKQFLTSIDKMTIESIKDAVFEGFSLIPLKRNANRNYLEEWIEPYYADAYEQYNTKDYIGSTYQSLYALYAILADCQIKKKIAKPIEYCLKKAADKPWDEAAKIFLNLLEFFYKNEEETFEMEEENEKEKAFDMSSITNQMGDFMKNYQSMLGGFMSSFGKKK